MQLNTIEHLLARTIGLSVEALGGEVIRTAVRRRMEACQLQQYAEYVQYLAASQAEWAEFVEEVVVPETWFFRNQESYAFLEQYIQTEWMPQHQHRMLRVLSVPCSTGEEPYSIAMTLNEAGLPHSQFTIDAVDISTRGLQKARQGLYGQESFRHQDLRTYRKRYFQTTPAGYQIRSFLQQTVRFIQGNVVDKAFLLRAESYDIVFCRNLLIYLTDAARQTVVHSLNRLLAQTGLLFVGHAEGPLCQQKDFVWVLVPGVFAYRKTAVVPEYRDSGKHQTPSRVEQRSQSDQPPPALPRRPGGPKASESVPSQRPAPVPTQASASERAFDRSAPSGGYTEPEQSAETAAHTLARARDLADQGELQQALQLCEQVLANNAADLQAHFLEGLIYQALRDNQRAEECFNKTLYLDPNHHEALFYLAFIKEDQGEHTLARRLRERIKRIHQRTAARRAASEQNE